ncbi:MAG: hypothetical protein DRJ45_09735 [Thermoprotei archaeon]|nr:MAG: hypothetical protein DRJ45_09735 [Thermoprotei archaeon]
MLEIVRKPYRIFKIKEIWFAEQPFLEMDPSGYDGIAFKACKKKVRVKGFIGGGDGQATIVIDLTKDLDEIWKGMDKSSCRYAINRAIRDGVKVKINSNYDKFFEIYKTFMIRKKIYPTFLSRLYDPKLEIMERGYGILFTAELEGEILGGCYFIHDDEHIRWLVGASKRLEVDRKKATLIGNANRLIIWEAIKWAKERGIKEFDLGGYSLDAENNPNDPRYGVNKFKKSFGGKIVKKYFYYKDYSRRLRLFVNLISKVSDVAPVMLGIRG